MAMAMTKTMAPGDFDNESIIQGSIVQMNNDALSFFLHGDYDKAREMLTVVYAVCQQRMLCHSFKTRKVTVDLYFTQVTHSIQNDDCVDLEQDDDSACDEGNDLMMMEDNEEGGQVMDSMFFPNDDKAANNSIEPQQYQAQTVEEDTNSQNMSTDTSSRTNTSGPLVACLPTSSDSASTLPSASFTMYNRALVLSAVDDDDQNLMRTSAIILYNLALVNHNIGMHRGVSTACWGALQLYEKALETLDNYLSKYQQSLPNTTLCCMWRILDVEKLLMALFNNMGNLHAHLFHFENTNACMKSLRIVLEASTAATRLLARNNNAIVMDEDYTFFLLNSLFQGKELCFAPAA